MATTGTISLRARAWRRRASTRASGVGFDARKRSMIAWRRTAPAVALAVGVMAADAGQRLLRLVLPGRGDLQRAGDEPGEPHVAPGRREQRALDVTDVHTAGAVRLEEAPVAGLEVAPQAGLLVDHRREHLLRVAGERVAA